MHDGSAPPHTDPAALSVALLGADALLAVAPSTPVQLMHACLAAGFDGVYPASWGDELIAAGCLERMSESGPDNVLLCACPLVRGWVEERGDDLDPYLVRTAPPPVVAARYLRAISPEQPLVITFVGGCPGADDPAIDVRLTPPALLRLLARRGIGIATQPTVFESILPPDRRRFYSLPGGLPHPERLEELAVARHIVSVYEEDAAVALADALVSGSNGIVDIAPRMGCLCAGATAGRALLEARDAVLRLEPPRTQNEVVDTSLHVDVSPTPVELPAPEYRSNVAASDVAASEVVESEVVAQQAPEEPHGEMRAEHTADVAADNYGTATSETITAAAGAAAATTPRSASEQQLADDPWGADRLHAWPDAEPPDHGARTRPLTQARHEEPGVPPAVAEIASAIIDAWEIAFDARTEEPAESRGDVCTELHVEAHVEARAGTSADMHAAPESVTTASGIADSLSHGAASRRDTSSHEGATTPGDAGHATPAPSETWDTRPRHRRETPPYVRRISAAPPVMRTPRGSVVPRAFAAQRRVASPPMTSRRTDESVIADSAHDRGRADEHGAPADASGIPAPGAREVEVPLARSIEVVPPPAEGERAVEEERAAEGEPVAEDTPRTAHEADTVETDRTATATAGALIDGPDVEEVASETVIGEPVEISDVPRGSGAARSVVVPLPADRPRPVPPPSAAPPVFFWIVMTIVLAVLAILLVRFLLVDGSFLSSEPAERGVVAGALRTDSARAPAPVGREQSGTEAAAGTSARAADSAAGAVPTLATPPPVPSRPSPDNERARDSGSSAGAAAVDAVPAAPPRSPAGVAHDARHPLSHADSAAPPPSAARAAETLRDTLARLLRAHPVRVEDLAARARRLDSIARTLDSLHGPVP